MKTARLFLLLASFSLVLLALYISVAEEPKQKKRKVEIVEIVGTDTSLSRRGTVTVGENASLQYRTAGSRPFSVDHLAQNISTASISIVSSKEEPSEGHNLQRHNASLTVRRATNATTNATHSPSLQSATLKSAGSPTPHENISQPTAVTIATSIKNSTMKISTNHPATLESSKCTDINCLNYLSVSEKRTVNRCKKDTEKQFTVNIERSKCRFLSDNSRKAVALASPEGSGNTWLRGLLENATGVCTGFCCCDEEMRAQGFVGEGIISGKVLVVKTHLAIAQWVGGAKKLTWEGSYGSAVVLVRNPAMALIAERHRSVTNSLKGHKRGTGSNKKINSHTNAVSEALFRNEKWESFAEKYLNDWVQRLKNWVLNNHNHPVHVVNYEDLKRDTVGEVEKILDFLPFPYSHDELTERLREDYTVFHRPHTHENFEHFSPEQKEKLKNTLLTVLDIAKDSGKEELFLFFNDYLESLPDVV